MTADHFAHLDQFGADLWKLADQLRANSGLASESMRYSKQGMRWGSHILTQKLSHPFEMLVSAEVLACGGTEWRSS